ncbi:sphingomyelin synthase [Apophysomyces ossiformis]|uniref:Sphingomyelin synthase n=1 Tax=Apophysomyces ossiformis TaxID=679940 RepID=A0A8H7BXS4_9FUNG|nr:sphingomyelin synthase [Apophysomyces ossiformis]
MATVTDGAHTVAPYAAADQTIGMIKLRLQPPSQCRTRHDLVHLVFNHEVLRTVIAVAWLILGGFIECLLAQASDMRYAKLSFDKHALADLLHDNFPRVYNFQIVNYLTIASLLYTLIGFAFQLKTWSVRLLLLRRWLMLMGALYIFRGITLLVTTLPSPLFEDCQPPEVELTGNFGERLAFLFIMITGNASSCTDNIFSGHTAAMMSCVMTWRIHSRWHWAFSWVCYLIVTSSLLMMCFTRFHYTVDIVLAIYITYMAWRIYLLRIADATKRYYAENAVVQMEMSESKQAARDPSASESGLHEYLEFQPNKLGQTWFLWACMYADGLDIRLRASGIFDERGRWRSNPNHNNNNNREDIA